MVLRPGGVEKSSERKAAFSPPPGRGKELRAEGRIFPAPGALMTYPDERSES